MPKTCKHPKEISPNSSIMAGVIAISIKTTNRILNSTAVRENMLAVAEVVEVAEDKMEGEEVVKIIMVIKATRWDLQGIMITTTVKEDRCKSSSE